MDISCMALSTYARERLAEPGSFSVRAHFSHVLNLSDGCDVLSVQDEGVPWTPLSLVLGNADFRAFCRLAQDRAGLASGDGGLKDGALVLSTHTAQRFSCRLAAHSAAAPGVEVYRRLRTGAALLAKPDSLAFAGDPELAAWAGGGPTDAQRMARRLLDEGRPWDLVGLGPGLTPSGDDFLVGLLAVWTAWEGENARQTLADQVSARLNRTGELSGAFLRCALEGEFSLPVLEVIRVLNQDAENQLPALARLCSIGHSSGSDLLGGVLYGLRGLYTGGILYDEK
ncbi:MAG: DUF2877 domain-containing protein [Clostridia bacterium]|nr:DUF2877 domain-containing protein [Clostridia bacterium]